MHGFAANRRRRPLLHTTSSTAAHRRGSSCKIDVRRVNCVILEGTKIKRTCSSQEEEARENPFLARRCKPSSSSSVY